MSLRGLKGCPWQLQDILALLGYLLFSTTKLLGELLPFLEYSLMIRPNTHVCSALAAFFQHVHIWYPILSPGFSEQYFRIISGPLIPSPDSCLVLLVAAVGLLAQEILGDSELTKSTHSSYFEAAMAWLPIVVSDCELTSIKCLVLISVYYCCLLRPYQAHNYCLIASSKIQNLLKG